MLIVNPVAGRNTAGSFIGGVLEILYNGGYIPTVFYTSGVGDATRLVLEYGPHFECVACVGGDGTLSETVAGLAQLETPPLLGYIPQGTANDVASTLKLSRIPQVAAKTITNGTPSDFDVGRFNERDYFTYIAAFGAFTEVSYETSREMKQTLGHLGYVLTAMGHLPAITDYQVRVEHDFGVIEDRLIFGSVSNSTSVAGIVKLDQGDVELDDGLFEVLLIKTPANLAELNNIISHVLSKSFTGGKVTLLRSKKVKFSFDQPVKWTRDGESGGLHSQVLLENIPSPIKIMT
jgi:YegS/Rv2252/BmrU family lipid kinase